MTSPSRVMASDPLGVVAADPLNVVARTPSEWWQRTPQCGGHRSNTITRTCVDDNNTKVKTVQTQNMLVYT